VVGGLLTRCAWFEDQAGEDVFGESGGSVGCDQPGMAEPVERNQFRIGKPAFIDLSVEDFSKDPGFGQVKDS
jgi:hypothetical protein